MSTGDTKPEEVVGIGTAQCNVIKDLEETAVQGMYTQIAK